MEIADNQELGEMAFLISFYTNGVMIYSEYDVKTRSAVNPQALTEDNSNILTSYFNKEIKDEEYGFKGFIPANVLSFKTKELSLIWTTEKCQKELLFQNDNISSGLYPIPRLLWKYHKKNLYVYAIKSDKDNSLYQAPFLNTYSDGSICLGSVKIKSDYMDLNKVMRNVENSFFNSYFTHTNTDNLIKGNIVSFYKSHIGKKDFPDNLLVKINLKKESLL